MGMALIHSYDTSLLDETQLEKLLGKAGKSVEFTAGELTAENADHECEFLSVFIGSKVTKELMAKMPKLKLIACRSTGFNNVDVAAAAKRGVKVVNVPTYGENTVAEYAFALTLALVRKLPEAMELFVKGEGSHEQLRGMDLKG